jgi:two-component system response regulator HydG
MHKASSIQPHSAPDQLGTIRTVSAPMRAILNLIRRASEFVAPVLITGESGVGKELVAKALHDISPRRRGPFVPVNCGALSPELAESEIFGHVRGAYTGAHANTAGAMGAADRGTLFLDEIGELPLALQPKLLRALETLCVRPVGATRERPVDVRIIAATNRNLPNEVAQGRFRQDLFYRLDVLRVPVPSLRERIEDIPLLCEDLMVQIGHTRHLDPDAMDVLMNYAWPGNVRELRNVLIRAALRDPKHIRAQDLRAALPAVCPALVADEPSVRGQMYRYVSERLDANGGDGARTWRELEIPKSTFYRWLRHGRISHHKAA